MTLQEQAAILRALKRMSYRKIGLALGVSEMTVYGWLNPEYVARQREHAAKKRAEQGLTRGQALARVQQLEEQLALLQVENRRLRRNLNTYQRRVRIAA